MADDKRQWTSVDVQRGVEDALDHFAYSHYRESDTAAYRSSVLRSLPSNEQLRILRAFESAFKFMRQTVTDELASVRAQKRVKRGV